jgi:hypothetical protein
MEQFLTSANLAHVSDVALRFLADKYGWAPPGGRGSLKAFESVVVSDVMRDVAASADADRLTLGDLNKRVISGVRFRVLGPAGPAEAGAGPGPGPSSADAGAPLGADLLDRGEATKEDAEDAEASFMEKLQDLEQQRKVIFAATPAPAAPVAAAQPSAHVGALASQAPAPAGVTLLAPPMPARRPGVPLYIHGWDRDRRAWPKRSVFGWNSRLPAQMDPGHLKVAAVWVPTDCLGREATPYLRLQVEGAGRQIAEAVVVPGATSARWTVCAPCTETLGMLPALSPPWIVRCLNATGHPIDMGTDETTVSFATRYSPTTVLLELADPEGAGGGAAACAAAVGDLLHVYTESGELSHYRVSGATGARVLIDAPLPATPGAHGAEVGLVGATLVNASRQLVVLLEGSQTTHRGAGGAGGG